MHTENKKELALEIIRRLKQAYPDAACMPRITTKPGSFSSVSAWPHSVPMPA